MASKKTELAPSMISVVAAPGKLQPIFYKGSIIRIGDKDPVDLDLNALVYQPRAQLDQAIKSGDVLVVKSKKVTEEK